MGGVSPAYSRSPWSPACSASKRVRSSCKRWLPNIIYHLSRPGLPVFIVLFCIGFSLVGWYLEWTTLLAKSIWSLPGEVRYGDFDEVIQGPSGRIPLASVVREKYVLLVCHRGQFSNHMCCLRRGPLIARALNRRLIMPVFSEVQPPIDVSKLLDMDCFRNHNQAVTFPEFRQSICQGVQSVPAGGNSSDFCADGSRVRVPLGYSLEEVSGYSCSQRQQDIVNLKQQGIDVGSCQEVPSEATNRGYSLDAFVKTFGAIEDSLLVFLDMFDVAIFENEHDIGKSVSRPEEFCMLTPAKSITQAADKLMSSVFDAMHLFIDYSARHQRQIAMVTPQIADQRARYMAAHIRRGDWFYYCHGLRNCFYSIAEVAACLNADVLQNDLSVVYIATNADKREKQMLREGINAAVVFWDDLQQLLLKEPGIHIDVTDKQMVSMLEKAVCAQAAVFVSSSKSTFSEQIIDFRNKGLLASEVTALQKVFKGLDNHTKHTYDERMICHGRGPPLPDPNAYFEFYNINVFLTSLYNTVPVVLPGNYRKMGAKLGQSPATPAPTSMWQKFESFLLTLADSNIIAATNRFALMYMSPVYAAVSLSGVQHFSPQQLADHLANAIPSNISVLYVSLHGCAEVQAHFYLNKLKSLPTIKHVVVLGDAEQEQGAEWTLLYHGDGHARHSEPAVILGLDGLFSTVDAYITTRSTLFLGCLSSGYSQQVLHYRRIFGMPLQAVHNLCS